MYQQMGPIILSWRILLRQPACATCRSSCPSPFVVPQSHGCMCKFLRAIPLADGCMDLFKFLIIHGSSTQPATLCLNVCNFHRLLYLARAQTDWWFTRPVRSVFNIFSPSVKFSFLCSRLAGDKHSYLRLMDSLTGYYFLECYFHWIYDLSRVIFTLITPFHLALLQSYSSFSLLNPTFASFFSQQQWTCLRKNTHLLSELSHF